MVLCSVYYESGFEDKYETIVHEMTHASARVEDHKYMVGYLARIWPSVINADNYGYFTDKL